MPAARHVVVTSIVLAVALSACTAADEPAVSPTPVASASPTASGVDSEPTASAVEPAVIDNCGFPITTGTPPERILTIKSTTTELLVALGLEDRIVAAVFLDGPLDADVPIVSDNLPGQEAALALEPDAVFAGWESNFSADGIGEREFLDDLGILTYVAPSACKGAGYMPDPMTFELLFDHILEAGDVFGVPEEAAQLATELETDLAAIEPDPRGLTALWYSSGSDTPYVGAGLGAPQMMLAAAGMTNIAADIEDTWTSLTWEAVAIADPDVIVLVDADWNSAASKIAMLEDNPATAQLSAVRDSRYATIPFAAGEAGVRNVDAVASLVEQVADVTVDD